MAEDFESNKEGSDSGGLSARFLLDIAFTFTHQQWPMVSIFNLAPRCSQSHERPGMCGFSSGTPNTIPTNRDHQKYHRFSAPSCPIPILPGWKLCPMWWTQEEHLPKITRVGWVVPFVTIIPSHGSFTVLDPQPSAVSGDICHDVPRLKMPTSPACSTWRWQPWCPDRACYQQPKFEDKKKRLNISRSFTNKTPRIVANRLERPFNACKYGW